MYWHFDAFTLPDDRLDESAGDELTPVEGDASDNLVEFAAMTQVQNAFKAMALREFYCEPRLADEFRAARWLAVLGGTVVRPASKVIGGMLNIPPVLVEYAARKIMTERIIAFPVRMLSDLLAQWKSDTDNYQSCCRSALCYTITNSYGFAFTVLRHAAWKNDDWARHHHIYGLIHGIQGNYQQAQFELKKAESAEPYRDARQRIWEAASLAEKAGQTPPEPASSLRDWVSTVLGELPELLRLTLDFLDEVSPCANPAKG